MADLIGLINDISTAVKLEWIGVLLWGTVQFVWYRRARVLPGTVEAAFSISSSFPSVTRPPETEPVELAAPQVPVIAADVESDVLEDAGLPSESDLLAEFQEPGTPRRRSPRRRRSTASGGTSAVSGFALDMQKTT